MIAALALAAVLAAGGGARRREPVAAPVDSRMTGAAAMTAFTDRIRRTPSFARQMKLSCNTCHLGGFPQLTRFGRLFKLNGYTLSGLPEIVNQLDSASRRTLSLSPIPGLSLAAVIDASRIAKPLPGAATTIADYPQQVSLFYGGEIAPKLGALVQLTYSGTTGRISMDNSDIRFASHTTVADRDLLYGVTLHNNPTVQDAWNTGAAWSYPFVSPGLSPRPIGATQLDGGLAQQVLGLGTYALYDNILYAEVSAYTASPGPRTSGDSVAANSLRNVSPYWRLALQNRNGPTSLMIGAFGLSAERDATGLTGSSNRFSDVGIDAQAEREVGAGALVVRAAWIHESQSLSGAYAAVPRQAEHLSNSLEMVRANAAWSPNHLYTMTLGYFSTTGTADARLYAPEAAIGSRTGRPDTQGTLGELTINPWMNVRFGAQYLMYQKFNGSSLGYDIPMAGRDARDNNTLMLYTWFAF